MDAKSCFSMSTPKKAKVDLDVGDIAGEHEKVTVHGVVTELSPIKSSASNPKVKYFTGKL